MVIPLSIYIKAKVSVRTYVRMYVCVCVHVARQWQAVAMQQGRFIWGPFWGCCLATTISWWCFLFGPVAGQQHNNGVAFSLGSVPRTLANASSKLLLACLQQPAKSMAGETSQQPEARPER
jgi:hypothetical protein